MNDIIDNDTGEILLPISSQEMSPLVAAEINQQIATAKKYPRRADLTIREEIMGRSSLDEETAAECMYSLPRGGKNITGPSIRFAEIVMASYGNLRVASRFVEIDARDPERVAVIVEGVCLDLQSNVSRIIPVRRSIMTSGKSGKKPRVFDADMTNIAVAAGSAIATREAILKIVPKTLWGAPYHRVVRVLQGDAETLSARREKVIAAFGRRDIQPKVVFSHIGVKSIEEITLEHMPQLFGMLTALADGSETPISMFGGNTVVIGERERVNPLQDDDAEGAAEIAERQREVVQTEDRLEEGQDVVMQVVEETRRGASTASQQKDELPPQPTETKTSPEPSPGAKEQAQKPAAPAADGLPTNEEGYIAHARAWFPTMNSRAEADARWKSERKLRTTCIITSQALELLRGDLDRQVYPAE